MRNLLEKCGGYIRRFLDYFYPPFRNFLPVQMFRYGVTGVANILFDWALYFVFYNFILSREDLHLGILTFSAPIAALACSFPISFLSGFLLQKYVTFSASSLRGHVQLMRYLLVVLFNLGLNYGGLKLFVEVWHFYPTPSKMIITIIATLISYVGQKKFTFRN